MTDRRWVVTCDPGVDDAIALAVAAGRPDCDVRAVVAGAGNVDAATAWRNAAGLATLFGLDVPVALGSAVALDGAALAPDDRRGPHGDEGGRGGEGGHGGGRQVRGGHGTDGLAGLSDRLPEVSGTPATAGTVVRGSVIALGPLTDVALALRAGLPLDRVVWMGGTIGWHHAGSDQPGTSGGLRTATGPESRGGSGPSGGAATSTGPARLADPAPEFNASADVVAVDEVLAGGLDVSVVPRDVTGHVTLDAADLDRWDAGPVAARLCAAMVRARRRARSPVLHDPVVVVAALEPDLFTWQLRPLRCCRGDGHPRGALLPDPECGGPARVAVAVDAPAARRRIVAAVLALPG